MSTMKKSDSFLELEQVLRSAGMAYPEVTEDFPWGHRALKVNGKAFIFMALEDKSFSLSVKLPDSHPIALTMPFATPTGYALGRSGWVTATFTDASKLPLPVLLSWLEESFRAVAPKRLVRALPSSHSENVTEPQSPTPARRRKSSPR